ncbi:unnamed protein product [Gongylonema pulchrum]|uniref:Mutator family transposase n=1 Tax=Gongylonema pulchrum TaxID=637853 RepID=A0A183EG02_9BILA|nr:unnamed protein product [Gongylonema pulchrum]
MIKQQIKDLILDKVVVSALTQVTSVVFDSLDDIEIKKKWQEIVNYLRGRITAEELGKRFWRKYVPEVKRVGPGEYEFEVTVPHGATSLKQLLSDLHPQRFLALKSAVAESLGLSEEEKVVARNMYLCLI